MASTYVLQSTLPTEIEQKIKRYLLGYGTKLCQLVKPNLIGLPQDCTWWKWKIDGNLLYSRYGIAWCEMMLVYMNSKLEAETDPGVIEMYCCKIKIVRSAIDARFKLKYHNIYKRI